MSETKRTFGERVRAALRAVGRFIKRHKKVSILVVALVLVAAILLVVFGGGTGTAVAQQMPQTTVLQRMDLQQVVAGTGTLQSSVTREVTSGLSYEIAAVYVKEGDAVEADQLLAQLDTTELDKTIAEVRKSITDAEASDALALAQAERKLQDAINSRSINLDKNNAAIQEAQTALTGANNAQAAIDAATSALSKAQQTWEDAKTTYGLGDADGPSLTDGEDGYAEWDALQKATTAEADAQRDYAATAATRPAAQSTYDKAVETRDATYRNDSISIENAQDSVNNQKQKDSAANYRTQLEGYLDDREDCAIKAPIAGTVTAMAAEVGQSAGGGMGSTAAAATALFTIEDTDQLEITSSIAEYDVVNVKAGMAVKITSDALDGAEWSGTVKSVSAKATDTNGNFTVVVQVVSPVGDLAIGMSAKINIVTESANNVFAVPYDAVTTNEAGQSVIIALDIQGQGGTGQMPSGGNFPAGGQRPSGGEMPSGGNLPAGAGQAGGTGQNAELDLEEIEQAQRSIVVQTGMETDYYIEIIGSELQEGMLVLTDPENKTVSTDAPAGFGGFGGGMGPMGGG